MKIIIIILSLFYYINDEQLTAIEYYNELQFKCVPNTLREIKDTVVYKDSVYIMQYDMNYIPWVIKKPVAN
jgi:hypothetical protein